MYNLLKGGPGSTRWGNHISVADYKVKVEKLKKSNFYTKGEISGGSTLVFLTETSDGDKFASKAVSTMGYEGYESVNFFVSKKNGSEFSTAASDISASLGSNCVPTAIVAKNSKGIEILHTEFKADADVLAKKLPSIETYDRNLIANDIAKMVEDGSIKKESFEKLAIIDSIVGQRDGHGYNYLIDNSGNLYGIDYNISGADKRWDGPTSVLIDASMKMSVNKGNDNHTLSISADTIRKLPPKLSFASSKTTKLNQVLQKRYENFLAQTQKPFNLKRLENDEDVVIYLDGL